MVLTRVSRSLSVVLLVLCVAGLGTSQIRCLDDRVKLLGLMNELRDLEGLPPLPSSGAPPPHIPIKPQGANPPVPTERDEVALARWHGEHDAEVQGLRNKLAGSECQTLNPPPEWEHPYDLVWGQYDDNSIPLSPVWKSTVTPPFYTRPDPSQCGGGNPWMFPCTTQKPRIDNNPGLCPTGDLGGHANWIPATFMGRIYWEGHSLESQDDDYNFNLLPLLSPINVAWTTATDSAAGLHLEFSSDDTIDHFHTPWWSKFHAAVDDDDSRSLDNPFGEPRRVMVRGKSEAQKMIYGRYAIVSGLMGLDCAHSCGAEVHPVWALAIQVQDDPADEIWAFFFTNWGNEGYCSKGQERIDLQRFTFRLPWRPGAGHVDVISTDFRWRLSDNASWSFEPRPAENSVLVSFTIAPVGRGDRMNGELHLRWGENPARLLLSRAVHPPETVQRAAREVEGEIEVAKIVGNLSPARQAVLRQRLPRRDLIPDSKVGKRTGVPPAPRSTVPRVRSAPDARAGHRSQQRAEALKAALRHRQ